MCSRLYVSYFKTIRVYIYIRGVVLKFVPASNSLLTILMIIKYNKIFVIKYAIGIEEARLLSEQEKSVRFQTSKRFLERYAREGERFLQSIITSDESWLPFYDLETKAKSIVWKKYIITSTKEGLGRHVCSKK